MRYCFVSDGDHWYLLPVENKDKFYKMLDEGEEDWYSEFNNLFNIFRCDSPTNYTFENPK